MLANCLAKQLANVDTRCAAKVRGDQAKTRRAVVQQHDRRLQRADNALSPRAGSAGSRRVWLRRDPKLKRGDT